MYSTQPRTISHNVRLILSLAIALLLLMSLSFLVVQPKEARAATTYTITASVKGLGGTVSPASQVVNAGATASVSITPDSGQNTASIVDNEVGKPIANPYQIANVQANHNVVVTFYGYEAMHVYKSSVDGADLPCSIYKPNPADVTRFTGGDVKKIPLWVDLHAFGGHGGLTTPTGDYNNMFMISPWGRNYRSFWADTKEIDPNTIEPSIYDEFSSSPPSGWTPWNGNWSVTGGSYQQDWNPNVDPSPYWAVSDRSNSTGHDYTTTVFLKEIQRKTTESAMGVTVRKQTSGNNVNDCYWVDLDDNNNNIYLRVFKLDYQTLTWTPKANDAVVQSDLELGASGSQVTGSDPLWTRGVNLTVSVFENTIEIRLNNMLHNLDPANTYNADDPEITIPFTSIGVAGRIGRLSDWDPNYLQGGNVALVSYGGTHQFDNFRVQNDMLYGETDVLDCINQFIEEFSADANYYRVDPTKVYLSGYSMGGLGTWIVGLHNPDLFSALHPKNGTTDLQIARDFIKTYYRDNQPAGYFWPFSVQYNKQQDSYIGETTDAFVDYIDPNTDTTAGKAARSGLREDSARYILENALNMPLRIQHAEYDSLIPNVVAPYAPLPNQNDPSGPNLWIFWSTPQNWIGHTPAGQYLGYGWEQTPTPALPNGGSIDPTNLYAHSNYVWQKLINSPSLQADSREKETSGYTAGGTAPTDQSLLWDDGTNPSYNYAFGGHGSINANWNDDDLKIWTFWNRAQGFAASLHLDPPTVAYKSYDSQHNKAWWLNMSVAYPDQAIPGLARVANGRKKTTPYDGAEIHVKNVATTTLDLTRMGIDTTNSSTSATKPLTFKIDSNTAPESEPVTDTYNKTTLKLAGTWFPANWANYTVKLGTTDLKSSSSVTGSVLTINNVPVTTTQTTLTVTVPKNVSNNMINMITSNPGFESGTTGWTSNNGGGTGTFDIDSTEQSHANTGTKSARIRNAKSNNAEYVSTWEAGTVAVTAGTKYVASAFVKTKALQSVKRVFSGGKYDPNTNSNAGVRIVWLDNSNNIKGTTPVTIGINGSKDWTPVLTTSTAAPTGTTKAKVVMYVKSFDAQGTTGSAWFDDVALLKGV